MPRLLLVSPFALALLVVCAAPGRAAPCSFEVQHGLQLAQAFYKDSIVYRADDESSQAEAQWNNLTHQLHLITDDMLACRDKASVLEYSFLSAEVEAAIIDRNLVIIADDKGLIPLQQKADEAELAIGNTPMPRSPDTTAQYQAQLKTSTFALKGYLSTAYALGLPKLQPTEYARLKGALGRGYSALDLPYESPEHL